MSIVPATSQTPSLGEPLERSSRSAGLSVLLALAAIAYLAVAPFPSLFAGIRPGLDASWIWVVNWLPASRFRFGRDVAFTFGPLGYLLYPANVGQHVLASIVFRWAVAILGALPLIGLSAGRHRRLAIFAVVNAIAIGLGQYYEFHLLVLAALGGLLAVEKRSALALFAVALCAAPLALMKFNVGIGAAAVVVTAAILLARSGRAASAAAAVAIHLFALAALTVALTGSPWNALRWFRASYELAAGYSAAMSIDPGWSDQPLGILMLACYAIVTIVLWRLRSRAATGLLLLAGPLFVAFKAGFVREDAHVISFYSFAVAAAGMAVLDAGHRRERIAAFGSIAVISCIALFGMGRRGYLDRNGFLLVASGLHGARGLAASFEYRDTMRYLDRVSTASLVQDRLPEDVRAALGTRSVLVWPWEHAYCPANQLSCVPQPTVQSYAAYTPWLDGINAELLEGPGAPDFVLVHSAASIDGRNIALEAPLWWRALVRWYEPLALPSKEPLVFRRRAAPLRLSRRDAGFSELRMGEWLPLPEAGGLLFAEVRLRPNLRGLLVRQLVRVPPLMLQLRLASGESRWYRIVPDTATNGLPLSPVASSLAELRDIFANTSTRRAIAFRVTGNGTRSYRSTADVSFFALDR